MHSKKNKGIPDLGVYSVDLDKNSVHGFGKRNRSRRRLGRLTRRHEDNQPEVFAIDHLQWFLSTPNCRAEHNKGRDLALGHFSHFFFTLTRIIIVFKWAMLENDSKEY